MLPRILARPARAVLGGLVVAALADALNGAVPRVLPQGQLPADSRLQPPKDLDGYFPFHPPASREAWQARAERVRRRILVSQGLWPMPTRTPLNAVIHGRIDRGEYTVEKVYFESRPGFFVTGNLYRPKGTRGKVPAVLFAHGHWTDARLSEATDAELRKELADGAERFEQGGRSRFQSMCVQLARMGCVVWQWDMLGNSDSQQIPMGLAHGFSKQRPEMNTELDWGLFSPQAEAHLQSVMGLQTWNAVRSLDFVLGLPEVDPGRVAITGASGGGTQTMLLAAIDPRIALSFPAVMVSTAMQGGCTCENASLLRIGTGNVEFAALFAPKPQGMTCADDWTREMSTKGFPELKRLYGLLGAPENVMLKRGEYFPHNYNAVSRSAFETWLNRHFKLGFQEPVVEREYQPLKRAELTVWDDAHPAPRRADPAFERRLLAELDRDAGQLLAKAAADDNSFREIFGGGWDTLLDGGMEAIGEASWEMKDKSDEGTYIRMAGMVRDAARATENPAVFLYPKQWNGRTTLWLTGEGKAGLCGADGSVRPEVRALLDAGTTVLGMDLLYQGEFLAGGGSAKPTPKVKNPRESAAFTFGYNDSVFVQRVRDVLTAVKYIRGHERKSSRVDVVGVSGAGPVVAAARALARSSIDRAAIETGGFRFSRLLDFRDPDFVPGGAKYGDLPALLALGAPGRTLVSEELKPADLASLVYGRLGARTGIRSAPGDGFAAKAAAFLAEE